MAPVYKMFQRRLPPPLWICNCSKIIKKLAITPRSWPPNKAKYSPLAASETEIKLNKKLQCYKISLIVLILLCLVIISATIIVVVILYPRLFCSGNTVCSFRPT